MAVATTVGRSGIRIELKFREGNCPVTLSAGRSKSKAAGTVAATGAAATADIVVLEYIVE
jgi:hypothetical protein